MKRRHNNSAGFTLIEIVVAITLMSLIMMTLVMGLRLTANAWRRGEQKLEERANVLAGADAMADQVSAAAIWVVTQVGADNKPTPVVAFAGSPSELRFCTAHSWRGDRSRPRFMADYRVVKDVEGKQQLVFGEVGLMDDASVLVALQSQPTAGLRLGAPADQIQLAYYRPATPTLPGQWVGDWQPLDGAELPRAVRITWMRGKEVQQATFPVAINHVVKLR